MSRLSYFFKRLFKMDWKAMWKTAGLLHERSGKSRIWLLCDMLRCAVKYNAGYVDYKIAQMYKLNDAQRKTVITRGISNSIVRRMNDKAYWHFFDDKTQFNELFKEWIPRKWLLINADTPLDKLEDMMALPALIGKPLEGSSGQGILANHLSQKYALEDSISKSFPKQIAEAQARIAGYGADIAAVKENTHPNADGFSPLALAGVTYSEKKEAGAALLTMCQNMLSPEATQVGFYRGLTLELSFDSFAQEYRLTMIGQLRHTVTLGTDVFGNLQRMDNALEGLPIKEQACREQLSNLQTQLETAKAEVQKPFPHEEELTTKTERLEELNALLNMDNKAPEPVQKENYKRKEELER